jgi:hypothetical protein
VLEVSIGLGRWCEVVAALVVQQDLMSALGLGHGSELHNAGGIFGCGDNVRSHRW